MIAPPALLDLLEPYTFACLRGPAQCHMQRAVCMRPRTPGKGLRNGWRCVPVCRLLLQDPNSRSEAELAVIRAFKDAAYKMLDREDRLVRLLVLLRSQTFTTARQLLGAKAPYRMQRAQMILVGRLIGDGAQVSYDLALARFYMWAQTEEQIFLAVLVPTGALCTCEHAAQLVLHLQTPPPCKVPTRSIPAVGQLWLSTCQICTAPGSGASCMQEIGA